MLEWFLIIIIPFFLQTTSIEKVRASSWHSPSLTTSMDDERELFFCRLFPFPPLPPNFISFSAPSEAGNLRCKSYNSLSRHYFTQGIVSSAVYFGDFKPKHQMLWVLYQQPTVVMIQQEINLFIISPPAKTPQLWLCFLIRSSFSDGNGFTNVFLWSPTRKINGFLWGLDNNMQPQEYCNLTNIKKNVCGSKQHAR